MKRLTSLFLVLSMATAMLYAPPAQAWNWGALWTVYDGAFPHEQYCPFGQMQAFGNIGGVGYSTNYAGPGGCSNNLPLSLIAASAGGAVQTVTQGPPYTFFTACTHSDADPTCPEMTYDEYGQPTGNPSHVTAGYISGPSTQGSSISVPPGTAVTIEWSCMNVYHVQVDDSCNLGMCNLGHSGGSVGTSNVYTATGGNNFATGGAFYGSTTVYPTTTTTYTLQCSGLQPGGLVVGSGTLTSTLPITVGVTDPCPTPIEAGWSSGSYLLYPSATRRFNAAGYNQCLTNNTSNYIFIPARTAAEASSFFANASRVGVSVF